MNPGVLLVNQILIKSVAKANGSTKKKRDIEMYFGSIHIGWNILICIFEAVLVEHVRLMYSLWFLLPTKTHKLPNEFRFFCWRQNCGFYKTKSERAGKQFQYNLQTKWHGKLVLRLGAENARGIILLWKFCFIIVIGFEW